MISDRKIKHLIKRFEKSEKFKTNKIYFYIAFFSVLVSVLSSFFARNRGSLITAVIVFLLVIFFLNSFYFVLNWLSMTLSLKNMKIIISNFHVMPFSVFEEYFSRLSFTIHPYILGHPVTLFFLGNIIYYMGDEPNGNYLINKAELNCPNLKRIKRGCSFASADIEYLLALLMKDQKLKSSYNAFELWKNKAFRYSIFISGLLFLIIHYLIQLEKVFNIFR